MAFPCAKCAELNDTSSPAPDDVASSKDETKDIAQRVQPFNACVAAPRASWKKVREMFVTVRHTSTGFKGVFLRMHTVCTTT